MRVEEIPFDLDPAEMKSGIETDVWLLEPRSPGLHQSDLIRDLENVVIKPGQRLDNADMSEEDRATARRYWELGFAWELILELVFKRRRVDGLDPRKFLRQVEIEHDGVFSTIDAIHIPDWRVLEYKLTFRSAGRTGAPVASTKPRVLTGDEAAYLVSEFWSWMCQLKGNCLGHGTRIASLFVFFVNGAYRPQVPQTRRFDFVFDDQDLLNNWRMLKQHEAVMRREGRIK